MSHFGTVRRQAQERPATRSDTLIISGLTGTGERHHIAGAGISGADRPPGKDSRLDDLDQIPSEEADLLTVIGENRRWIEQDAQGPGRAGCDDPAAAH